ncbi:hypothetical protein NSQ29_01325 [Paenibacillus sp. FSL F4-0236]|uniref:hypothetical protein n=1 Tax=Paenibacillus sp. FSL F4-0236 TaxID=2954731 RepID=UPI0030F56ABA
MPKAPVTIYDAQMRRVAWLENAFNIEYSMPLNSLWTAAFSLPGDDPKNAECKPFYFVELYDNNERVELFRIVPNTMNRNQSGPVIKYECEHVLATLADPTHPAILKFYVPEETARINKVMLSFQVEAFRAYSKAIEGGGAVTTSTAAGGALATTTASGGGLATTTESGGSSVQSTSSIPEQAPTTTTKSTSVESATTSNSWQQFAITVPDAVNAVGDHNHGIPSGTILMTQGGGTVSFSPSGGHSHILTSDHRHNVTIPGHNHSVTIPGHDHTVDLPNHSHGIDLPNHSHSINLPNHQHVINIPNHIHGIEYGIYSGPTPTALEIEVDGNPVPFTETSGEDIDIVPYLSKDGSGRVQRGQFHEIKIAPNSLGRIVANVVTQLFVQSRGGGNY